MFDMLLAWLVVLQLGHTHERLGDLDRSPITIA